MKAPKILPAIARRAGINEALALKLWRRAAGEAEALTGCCDSSEYFGLAVDRFLALVEDESGVDIARERKPLTSVVWICRHQRRMSQLALAATHSAYTLWHRQWQDLLAGHRHAA